MDGRKNNGAKKGENRGQGRKPKANEAKLIEMMDGIMDCNDLWAVIADKALQGCTASQKMWLEYRYGKPKQQVDVTTDGDKINQNEPFKIEIVKNLE